METALCGMVRWGAGGNSRLRYGTGGKCVLPDGTGANGSLRYGWGNDLLGYDAGGNSPLHYGMVSGTCGNSPVRLGR